MAGGDDNLSSYARGIGEGLGLRIDCEEPDILLLLDGAEPVSSGRPLVVVACGANAVRSVSRLLGRGYYAASTPETLEELPEEGVIPQPEPLTIHSNLVTCLEPSLLPEALRAAKRIAECIRFGRCLPPFTRLRLGRLRGGSG